MVQLHYTDLLQGFMLYKRSIVSNFDELELDELIVSLIKFLLIAASDLQMQQTSSNTNRDLGAHRQSLETACRYEIGEMRERV